MKAETGESTHVMFSKLKPGKVTCISNPSGWRASTVTLHPRGAGAVERTVKNVETEVSVQESHRQVMTDKLAKLTHKEPAEERQGT